MSVFAFAILESSIQIKNFHGVALEDAQHLQQCRTSGRPGAPGAGHHAPGRPGRHAAVPSFARPRRPLVAITSALQQQRGDQVKILSV